MAGFSHSSAPSDPGQITADKATLNNFFDDAIDSLEITYETYHEIDRHRPGCLSIMRWLLSKNIRLGEVLVISPYTLPLTMLFEKMGFKTVGIDIADRHYPRMNTEAAVRWKEFEDKKELSVNYDLIVCDNILQTLEYPGKSIQWLSTHLKPGGFFLMTGQNAARGAARLTLLTGGNVFPPLTAVFSEEGDLEDPPDRVILYREYTLGEAAILVSKSGFQVLDKQYMIGKAASDSYFPMRAMPLLPYLAWKAYTWVQRIIPPFRSHFFIAGQKPGSGTPGKKP